MKKRVFLAAFFLLAAGAARAEIGIEATVEPARARVGEAMTLTVVVNGAVSGVKPPKFPRLANFRSYSQGHSQEVIMSGGQMSSRSVFSYVLVPMTAGKHVLGQLEVDVGGKMYKTGVLEVDVEDPGSFAGPAAPQGPVSAPAARSLPPEYLAGKDVFVRAWVDKEEVFVNEPIYLTYTIYTRVSATFKGFDKEPVFTGFWVEEFPPQSAVRRQEKEIGGYRYVVADVRTVALFPNEPGVITLDPGVLKLDVEIQERESFDTFYSSDIFGRRRFTAPRSMTVRIVPRLLTTDPIQITAKPLPDAGKPADFTGAVGRYNFEASLDRSEVEEGEPVTLKLRVVGEGNLNTVEMPKVPETDRFKMYDSSNALNVRKERLIVEGEKVSETVLVPRAAGDAAIPPFAFSYFDPGARQYRTVKTNPLPLKVRKGREEAPLPIAVGPGTAPQTVSLLSEDIRFVKPVSGPLVAETKPLFGRQNYWALNVGLLAAGFLAFLVGALAERAGRDVSGRRLKGSHRAARRRLKTARAVMKKGREAEFYEALSAALYGYFADKFNLGAGEASMDLVQMKLKGKISPEEERRLSETVGAIQFARFAGGGTSSEEMKKAYGACDDLITLFEGKRL